MILGEMKARKRGLLDYLASQLISGHDGLLESQEHKVKASNQHIKNRWQLTQISWSMFVTQVE